MSRFNVAKVINSVPASPEPNTVYFVRKDEGFDLYVTNSDGVIVPRALNADIQAALLESELEALSQVVDTKVDKVEGKQLSTNDFTNSLKDKLAALESSRFKGIFTSLQALQDAIPVGEPGDYAHVDVELSKAVLYIWDNTDSVWADSGQEAEPLTAAQVKSLYEANANTNEFSDTEKTKLSGIAVEATKNATDAHLRDRATHTGVQPISSVSGLQTALDDKAASTDSRILNGQTAYTWGDHSQAGYVTVDTTYSAMSVAEGDAGAATTLRTMRSDYLRQIISKIPSVQQSAAYTATAADRGKGIDTTAPVTIPADTFNVGDVLVITNVGAGEFNISPDTGVTLRVAGTLDEGVVTLGAYGVVTLRLVSTNTWFVMGAGIK